MTVLLVEDEPIFRMDLASRLTRLGFDTVYETQYAEDALTLAAEHHLDLILMDIRLKGPMSGLEAAQRISRTSQTPIIVMSAYQLVEDEIREKVPSLVHCLAKPVADHSIEATIKTMQAGDSTQA